MLKTFGSKKTLELVIIAQLLGGLGVAYGQTTTSMVTTGNTADTPYTSIVVTQAAGKGSTMADDNVTYFTGVGRAKNAANIMLYMSGDGTLSVKDDGSAIIDGRNNGNNGTFIGGTDSFTVNTENDRNYLTYNLNAYTSLGGKWTGQAEIRGEKSSNNHKEVYSISAKYHF